MRTLVAGFGNVLRGDDGFGVEVVRQLAETGIASESVHLLDVGTGGIRLAQELLTPYDRLIVIDAVSLGQPPGTVSVRVVEQVEKVTEIDMHAAIPSRALSVAQALGGLPPSVRFIGCEPQHETLEELKMELSPAVSTAVTTAIRHVQAILAEPAHV